MKLPDPQYFKNCSANHAELVDAGMSMPRPSAHTQTKLQSCPMERGGFPQVGPGQAKLKKWQFEPKSHVKLIKPDKIRNIKA